MVFVVQGYASIVFGRNGQQFRGKKRVSSPLKTARVASPAERRAAKRKALLETLSATLTQNNTSSTNDNNLTSPSTVGPLTPPDNTHELPLASSTPVCAPQPLTQDAGHGFMTRETTIWSDDAFNFERLYKSAPVARKQRRIVYAAMKQPRPVRAKDLIDMRLMNAMAESYVLQPAKPAEFDPATLDYGNLLPEAAVPVPTVVEHHPTFLFDSDDTAPDASCLPMPFAGKDDRLHTKGFAGAEDELFVPNYWPQDIPTDTDARVTMWLRELTTVDAAHDGGNNIIAPIAHATLQPNSLSHKATTAFTVSPASSSTALPSTIGSLYGKPDASAKAGCVSATSSEDSESWERFFARKREYEASTSKRRYALPTPTAAVCWN